MQKQYLLAEKTIDEDDFHDLVEWIKTNPWLTKGPLTLEFEQKWAKFIGAKYALFVNSGSSANLLMYAAALYSEELGNRKVIVPAISWATSVAPAVQLGFEPIMCDADPNDFGLDMKQLEELCKRHKPVAVTMVHVLGVPNQMEQLLKLKKKYGFMLFEDACAATGSRYDNKLVGGFGDMSSFSFFYGHHLSTIEGGMICTSDETLHDVLLQVRSHGWPKDLAPEKAERQARARNIMNFNKPFTFYYPGFNVRSTDLNARIGLSQLKKMDRVFKRRIENHKIYQQRFLATKGFQCQTNPRATICSISFAGLAKSPEHRDKIAAALKAKKVETRPLGGGNMSRQPFWADRYGTTVFPVADRIHTTSFQLPNHTLLSPDDINFICDTVLSVKAA